MCNERKHKLHLRVHKSLAFSATLLLTVAFGASGIAWAFSYASRRSISVRIRGEPWEIVSNRGWISLDNQPAIDAERQRLHDAYWAEVDRRGQLYIEAGKDAWNYRSRTGYRDFSRETLRQLRERQKTALHSLRQLTGTRIPPVTKPLLRHAVPYAIPTCLTALIPLLQLFRTMRAAARRKKNCCVVCGYDLRASPNRCPECGTVAGGAHMFGLGRDEGQHLGDLHFPRRQ